MDGNATKDTIKGTAPCLSPADRARRERMVADYLAGLILRVENAERRAREAEGELARVKDRLAKVEETMRKIIRSLD